MALSLSSFHKRYPPIAWWIIGSTAITKLTQFMVMPFLAFYMSVHTHAPASIIGMTIGMSAISSTIFGFFGGVLADKYGRKRMMVLAMVLGAVVMAGFANARTIPDFFVLSMLSGLSQTIFAPASQAMLSDITSAEQKKSVFAMRYWAINVGASVGPLIGASLGTVSTGLTFYITSVVYLAYAIAIFFVFPESKPDIYQSQNKFRLSVAAKTVTRDRAFLAFLVAGLLTSFGYSQIDTTLPQYMHRLMPLHAAVHTFSFTLTLNAIIVIVLQWPLTKFSNLIGIKWAMTIGQILFALGYLSFAYAGGVLSFMVTMVIITFGEIIEFPTGTQYLSLMAADSYRATYFGANSLRQFGVFLGPTLGGVILDRYGGHVLFVSIAIVVTLGAPLYYWSAWIFRRGKKNSLDGQTLTG